ncbi:unnamed protein product [Effrenium voratum]|nr:unnamed protein product [Effrenium voratum]
MEGFVEESGWPCVDKQARRVECVSEFMDFVCSGDHSKGHICTLSDGIAKLKLDASIPATLLQACRGKSSSVEAVLEAIQQEGGPWTGELFWWPPGESHREEVCGDDLGDKLLRYRPFSEPCYVAELRGAERLPRGSHELTDTLTSVDVKDSGPRLPFWDRGHGFVGAAGSGLGLHVDQAWWSNIAKNFLGYKLVAIWGPGSPVLDTCGGELFRKPLSCGQLKSLEAASSVALLRPGDVACLSGGLPHTTLVVGSNLSLTFYESFLNWSCENLQLLLSGLERPIDQPWWRNNMVPKHLHTVLADIAASLDMRKDDETTKRFRAALEPLKRHLPQGNAHADRKRRRPC